MDGDSPPEYQAAHAMGLPAESPCKWCGGIKPLIEAHIYPRALARQIGGPGDPPTEYPLSNAEYPRRIPIGWYDPNILCADCDNGVFGSLDAYGVEFLRSEVAPTDLVPSRGTPQFIRRPSTDAGRLKLFCLSMLWRAAVSTQTPFDSVRLGPFEDRLRRHIQENDPGSIDDFSVLIARYPNDPGELWITPTRSRFVGGPRCYLMHFASHTVAVKVDSRAVTGPAREALLTDTRETRLVVGDIRSGPIGHTILRFFETKGWL